MASTYSNLKFELIGTGDQSGTWGTTTNTNLGTAIEEAITGSTNVNFASGNVTLTLTNTNTSQAARNLRLNLTGTTAGARDLIVPAISKLYLVNNTCADTVTVKNATGTGIAVPAGRTMWVFNNGTNVVDAVTHLTSLSLGTALAVTSGGTGATSASAARTNLGATTLGANIFTVTNPSAITFPRFNADNTVSTLNASDFRTAIGAGTVTSIAVSAGTGISVSGSPITGSGTITVTNSLPMVYPSAGIAVSTGSAWGSSLTAPSGAIVGTTDTQTLTNKRINPRVVAAGATSGTLTPNGDTTDVFNAFGLTGGITMAAPSGTPVDGQRLIIRIEDNGTGRTITWTTTSGAYRAIGLSLPTTTVASKITYVGCMYNTTDGFWDVIAVTQQT